MNGMKNDLYGYYTFVDDVFVLSSPVEGILNPTLYSGIYSLYTEDLNPAILMLKFSG